MLIEANPSQMLDAATRFRASGVQLLTAAADLRATALPEMPPAVAAQVGAALPRIARDLEVQADELDDRARELVMRAYWALVAGTGALKLPALTASRGLWSVFSGSAKVAEQRRVLQMLSAWSFYKTEVMPWALRGRTASLEAVNAWMLWQQEISHFMPASRLSSVVAGEGSAAYYLRVGAGPLQGLRGVAGKVTPAIGIVTSADTIARGSSLPGWRGDVDRYVAAPVGLGAAGIAGAGAVGLIALTPPGEIALGIALVGVGTWALGNVVYDNRRAIAHAVVGAGKWVGSHHEVLYGTPAGPALAVYDHRQEIAHGIVVGADWSKDRLADAGKTLVSGGGTVVDGVTSAPGKVVGGLKKLGGILG